jgi:hypothetical protein
MGASAFRIPEKAEGSLPFYSGPFGGPKPYSSREGCCEIPEIGGGSSPDSVYPDIQCCGTAVVTITKMEMSFLDPDGKEKVMLWVK